MIDLRTWPWISVVYLDGSRGELGIAGVFDRAHEIEDLVAETPVMRVSLLRMLLAIMHRAVDGPRDMDAYRDLCRTRKAPGAIGDYLDQWGDRFALDDPDRPFMQVAGMVPAGRGVGAWDMDRLLPDADPGRLFISQMPAPRDAATAARWLVRLHAGDVAGIKTGMAGDPEGASGRGYPRGTGWCGRGTFITARGANLWQTLTLNAVPLAAGDVSVPVWERPDPDGPQTRDAGPTGRCDLYTWQSRRVRLDIDAGDVVLGSLVGQGDRIADTDQRGIEPMTRWTATAKGVVYPGGERARIDGVWMLDKVLSLDPVAGLDEPGTPGIIKALEAAVPDAPVGLELTQVTYGTQAAVYTDEWAEHVTLDPAALGGHRALVAQVLTATTDAIAAYAYLADRLAAVSGVLNPVTLAGAQADATRQARENLARPLAAWIADLDPDPETARYAWHDTARTWLLAAGTKRAEDAGLSAWKGRIINGKTLTSPQLEVFFSRTIRKLLPAGAAPIPGSDAEPSKL